MVSRIGAAILVAGMAFGASGVRAAPAAPGGKSGAPGPGPGPSAGPTSAGRASNAGEGGTDVAQPQISQDAAARARMHECAHQWSSIKKAGNAGVTTWKEFSATCLVVSK